MAKRGRPKKKVEEVVEEKVEIEEIQEKEPEIVEKPEVIESEVQPEPELLPEPPKPKEDNHPKEKLFRFDEAGQMLGVNVSAIRMYVDHGHLVSVKIGGVRKITHSSILAFPFKRYG